MATKNEVIEVGKPVPNFTGKIAEQENIELQQLRGHNVVLYFYPKDCTSGCTLEGQDFRDAHSRFQALNTIILGVSRDNLKLHAKFKAEQNFPFQLISDTDESLCQLFDVIRNKTMYGKPVRGIERSTFLIDAKGVLRKVWRKVKVEGHVAEVLSAVENLA
jgi:peroxiredoxin Q/BCP